MKLGEATGNQDNVERSSPDSSRNAQDLGSQPYDSTPLYLKDGLADGAIITFVAPSHSESTL